MEYSKALQIEYLKDFQIWKVFEWRKFKLHTAKRNLSIPAF